MLISMLLGNFIVPNNLNLIAANGTDSLKSPIQTIHPQLDHLLSAIDTDDNAVTILFSAGLLTMRQKAGFTPAIDNRPLDKILACDDNEQEQLAYSSDILQILTRIYYSKSPKVYAEWLHWVALDDVTFPYEAIPLMLDLATDVPITRGLTKRVIGSRGRWLVEQSVNPDWYWVRHTKPAGRPRLTKYEKHESRVNMMLEKVRYQRIPVAVSSELRKMQFPWSERFSETIVNTIMTMLERQNRISLLDLTLLMDGLQWNLDPSFSASIVKNIQQYNNSQDFQDLADYVAKILEFRANLRAVFEKDRA